MTDKNTKRSQHANEETTELRDLPAADATEPENVKGGKATPKLLEAAVKGQVFKKVEIHGTA